MKRELLPLPTPDQIRGRVRGRGKRAAIRYFWGQACSLKEISTYLRVEASEISTVLRATVRRRDGKL